MSERTVICAGSTEVKGILVSEMAEGGGYLNFVSGGELCGAYAGVYVPGLAEVSRG